MRMYEFSADDAVRFANFRQEKYIKRGDELQLERCPYCGGGKKDRYTFSINLKTGQFKCLRASCDVSGNMITLSKDFDFSLGNPNVPAPEKIKEAIKEIKISIFYSPRS